MPWVPALEIIFFTLRLVFLFFFFLQVHPHAVAVEFFVATIHGAVLVCIDFWTNSTFVSWVFVVLRFSESEFGIEAYSFYLIVGESAKNMDDFILINHFHRTFLLMADKTSFWRGLFSGALLTDELPQFRIDKGGCCLHIVTTSMGTAFAFDAIEDIKTFIKFPGRNLSKRYKTYLAETVEDALPELFFLILHFIPLKNN